MSTTKAPNSETPATAQYTNAAAIAGASTVTHQTTIA